MPLAVGGMYRLLTLVAFVALPSLIRAATGPASGAESDLVREQK
jgi:hypothetical protein